MPKIVLEPSKIVTDPIVLNELMRQGIDKDTVELFKDYTSRSNGGTPFSKVYRELKLVGDTPRPTGRRILTSQLLPMCNALGQKIELGWVNVGGNFNSQYNLFNTEVNKGQIRLVLLCDQPSGAKAFDEVIWNPQLFINGTEVHPIKETPTLLDVDPYNQFLHGNVLEWDYGVCKRWLRVIQGRLRERWVFATNPHAEVRIKHNPVGTVPLRIGSQVNAVTFLNIKVNGDEEIISKSEWDRTDLTFPIEISDSLTVYPEPDVASNAGDSRVSENQDPFVTWATLKGGTGNAGGDEGDYLNVQIAAGSTTDRWAYIHRSPACFLTSEVGAGSTVTAVTMSCYGALQSDTLGISPTLNVYLSTALDPTSFVGADFSRVGDTPYCDTAITYAGFNLGTPGTINNWIFNAGVGIPAIVKDGITKTVFREATYDAGVPEPAWSNLNGCYMIPWATDKGAGCSLGFIIG